MTVNYIATVRAETIYIIGIRWLPATFITTAPRSNRPRCTAAAAKSTGILLVTSRTSPSIRRFRFLTPTLRTEICSIRSSSSTYPTLVWGLLVEGWILSWGISCLSLRHWCLPNIGLLLVLRSLLE